jgi:predicted RNase H-like HicB family nuclease
MERVRQLAAVIEREGDGYVATGPELDVVSQGRAVEEARMNLVEAVEGLFEVASPSEIRCRLKTETYVMPIMPVIASRRPKHAVRPPVAWAGNVVRKASLPNPCRAWVRAGALEGQPPYHAEEDGEHDNHRTRSGSRRAEDGYVVGNHQAVWPSPLTIRGRVTVATHPVGVGSP